jgi:hypothetical protein
MAAELNLSEAISMGARVMQANLRRQAPIKTGNLKRSITVRGTYDGKTLKFISDYLYYGKFTDLGTGPYKANKRGAWNPKPGLGRGGIRPRFWTTIDRAVQASLKNTIAKIVKEHIKFQLSRKAIL